MRRAPQQKSTKAIFSFGANVFLCTAYCPAGKPPKRPEPNILTWCCAVFTARSFRKAAPIEKNKYTLQCRFCVGDFHPVPLYRLSPVVFRMLLFTLFIIMLRFEQFVKTFTQSPAFFSPSVSAFCNRSVLRCSERVFLLSVHSPARFL